MKAMRKKAKGELWLFYTKKFPKIEPHSRVLPHLFCSLNAAPLCAFLPESVKLLWLPAFCPVCFSFFPAESLFPAAAY